MGDRANARQGWRSGNADFYTQSLSPAPLPPVPSYSFLLSGRWRRSLSVDQALATRAVTTDTASPPLPVLLENPAGESFSQNRPLLASRWSVTGQESRESGARYTHADRYVSGPQAEEEEVEVSKLAPPTSRESPPSHLVSRARRPRRAFVPGPRDRSAGRSVMYVAPSHHIHADEGVSWGEWDATVPSFRLHRLVIHSQSVSQSVSSFQVPAAQRRKPPSQCWCWNSGTPGQ